MIKFSPTQENTLVTGKFLFDVTCNENDANNGHVLKSVRFFVERADIFVYIMRLK